MVRVALSDSGPSRQHGKRLEPILREWDSGTRKSRMRQLDGFVARCSDFTGPQLEEELESGASLFLARISSWLRLSYALGHSVSLQLRAIDVFVGAPSGQRFLAEFVEVGGIATVIEILSLQQLPEDDKRSAMKLLSGIASAGRHYKEIVCEGDGVEALEDFMTLSKSEELLEAARDLLVTIGRGNPTFSTKVHRCLLRLLRAESPTTQRLACAGLRVLLKALPSSQLYTTDDDGRPVAVLDASYCEAAVSLLQSFNLQLLYEAGQLFSVLLSIEQLEEPLLRHLLQPLLDAADPRRSVPLHVQASAARALGQLVASLPPARRERAAEELDVVPWLCTLLARDTYSPECQKASLQALQLLGLCGGTPYARIEGLLGPPAMEVVMGATDATSAALSMTPEVLATLAPQIEAFLVVHRRSLKPEPLQMAHSVQEALAAVPMGGGGGVADTVEDGAPAEEEALPDAEAAPAPEDAATLTGGGDAVQPEQA